MGTAAAVEGSRGGISSEAKPLPCTEQHPPALGLHLPLQPVPALGGTSNEQVLLSSADQLQAEMSSQSREQSQSLEAADSWHSTCRFLNTAFSQWSNLGRAGIAAKPYEVHSISRDWVNL